MDYKKYTDILNDIYSGNGSGTEIAIRYDFTAAYISQTKAKIQSLKEKPKIGLTGRLQCSYCNNEEKLIIKNDTLICYSCSLTPENHNPVELLSFLNDFFKENVNYLMKNDKMTNYIIDNEEKFNEIEELVKDVK